MSLDPWCRCEPCTLRRELERAESVVRRVAVRLGHSPHDPPEKIIKTFDFMMDRYDQFMKEALGAVERSRLTSREDDRGEGAM